MWVPVGTLSQYYCIVFNTFDQRYKIVQTLSFLITCWKNFMIDCNMYLVSIEILDTKAQVSLRAMLVKSCFTSKLTITRLGSNSWISLAIENESFIIYSFRVIGLSNLSQNFDNLCLLQTKLDRKLEFYPREPYEF